MAGLVRLRFVADRFWDNDVGVRGCLVEFGGAICSRMAGSVDQLDLLDESGTFLAVKVTGMADGGYSEWS